MPFITSKNYTIALTVYICQDTLQHTSNKSNSALRLKNNDQLKGKHKYTVFVKQNMFLEIVIVWTHHKTMILRENKQDTSGCL